MGFFKQLETWLLEPWRNDIPLVVLMGFAVVFVVVCVWATDGLRLLHLSRQGIA